MFGCSDRQQFGAFEPSEDRVEGRLRQFHVGFHVFDYSVPVGVFVFDRRQNANVKKSSFHLYIHFVLHSAVSSRHKQLNSAVKPKFILSCVYVEYLFTYNTIPHIVLKVNRVYINFKKKNIKTPLLSEKQGDKFYLQFFMSLSMNSDGVTTSTFSSNFSTSAATASMVFPSGTSFPSDRPDHA